MESRKSEQFIRNNWVNIVLFILAVISLSVIITIKFFAPLRLSCNLPDEIICNINDVLLQLSLAYISALIFYIVTIKGPQWTRRSQQRCLIYDTLKEFESILISLEVKIGWDKSYDSLMASQLFNQSEGETRKEIRGLTKAIEYKVLQLTSLNIAWKNKEIQLMYDISKTCYDIDSIIGCQDKEINHQILANKINSLVSFFDELKSNKAKTKMEIKGVDYFRGQHLSKINMRTPDLSSLRFSRDTFLEQKAIDTIIGLLNSSDAECTYKNILELISNAHSTINSGDYNNYDDSEHRQILHTIQFLKRYIDEELSRPSDIYQVIAFLENVRNDAIQQKADATTIVNRLEFFINELKRRT